MALDTSQMNSNIADNLADHLGVQIVETLGEGIYGHSHFLDNEMVLKITMDNREPPCVARIAELEAWKLTPHLPYILQYGWYNHNFYYIREFTEQVSVYIPLLYDSPEFFDWVELIKEPISQIEEILNCSMTDDALDPMNWGIRHEKGDIVWRDLSCMC